MHRMKSKLLAIIMTTVMVFATLGTAFAATATDIQGHWAQQKLQTWADSGLISGYPDGTMKPNSPVTRAEFVTFLNRTLKVKNPSASASFSDVKATDWFYADVATASAAGYVNGYADGTFKPTAAITRQESAVIVGRVLGIGSPDLTVLNSFKDSASIAAWAKPSVAAMVAQGLMKGYEDGTFGAEKQISRAETVIVLDRGVVSAATPVVAVPTGGGGGGYSGGGSSTPSATVTVTSGTMTVAAGSTAQITATPVPSDATVTYASSDTAKATVGTTTGLVTGVAAGSATITVTASRSGYTNGSTTVVVTVTGKSVTVALSPAPVGKTATVVISGYTGATQFEMFKGTTRLCNLYAMTTGGTTELAVIPPVNAGDTITVNVYDATGTLLGTESVVATEPGTAQTGTVTVALSPAPVGKTATVALSGYTGATQFEMFKGTTRLCNMYPIAGGTTNVVVIPPVSGGDTITVKVYNAAGTMLESKDVVATEPSTSQTGTVAVALSAAPVGKTATVALSGYTGATQFEMFKGTTRLCNMYAIAGATTDVVVIQPVSGGDTITVKVYNAAGTMLESKDVVATEATPGGGTGGQTGGVSLALTSTTSGIGRVATLTITGYSDVTQYELWDSGGELMGDGRVARGTPEVVMYSSGAITVRLFSAAGTLIDTKTVNP